MGENKKKVREGDSGLGSDRKESKKSNLGR